MNITKPLLRRNRHEYRFHLRKLCNFCAYTGFLVLFVCIVPLILNAEDMKTETPTTTTNGVASATGNNAQETESAENTEDEEINGTAEHMERDEIKGITILTGTVKILRTDGYLNADKVTFYTDAETGATVRTIAEGNVEIRDAEIFATCEYALMEHIEDNITLEHNVVVIQNKDRLETALFKYNRTTGKQTGEGGVKFKVRVKQAEPAATPDADATGEDTGSDTDTSSDVPGATDGETQKETGTAPVEPEVSDTEEKPDTSTDEDGATPEENETDTDTGDPDDADADAETEGTENN